MSDQGTAATRDELADRAQMHYDMMSKECCSWSSVIPQAIEAWRKEPQLTSALAQAREALERFAKIDLTGPIGDAIAWDILNARAVVKVIAAALAALDAGK